MNAAKKKERKRKERDETQMTLKATEWTTQGPVSFTGRREKEYFAERNQLPGGRRRVATQGEEHSTENVNGCLHQEGALQKESEDNDPRGRLLGSLISYPLLLSYSWHPSCLIPTSLSSQSSNKMPEYLIMPMWYETIMTDGLVLNGRWKL